MPGFMLRQWPRVEVSRGTTWLDAQHGRCKRAAAKKTATKRLAQRYEAPTGSLKGREARAEERFRELAAWYVLQGMDESTARQLAQDEMDNETRKD